MENNQIITEKNYSITLRWVLSIPLVLFLINIIIFIFGYIDIRLIIIMIASLVWTPIVRSMFHYSIGEKFLDIKQGVIYKKTRHLPYGVIQTVFVKQNILDRILGIASLSIEDASNGGLGNKKKSSFFSTPAGYRNGAEAIGSSGNKINIPGLKKQHAEELKNIILKKMEDNLAEDSQSGL